MKSILENSQGILAVPLQSLWNCECCKTELWAAAGFLVLLRIANIKNQRESKVS